MPLSFRSARTDDLPPCFDSLAEAFAYPPALRRRVPALWAQWLAEGVMTAHVIERQESGRTVPEAFGATVFLRDGVVDAFRARGEPYLRRHLIERTLAGERVVLTGDEMRAANRGDGLTLFFFSDPRGRKGLTDEQYRAIDTKWSEALYQLAGCNLKTIWHEVYGEAVMRHVAGCGLRLRDDWADHWSEHGPVPPADQRPYLLGVTREEARQSPGTHASFLFTNVRPQFGLTARQQELLRDALDGATDDDLSARLNVSGSAVKKRWVAIYDRVSTTMPGWLDGATGSDARGTEKRRHLLNYLRQHPEELHPACASR